MLPVPANSVPVDSVVSGSALSCSPLQESCGRRHLCRRRVPADSFAFVLARGSLGLRLWEWDQRSAVVFLWKLSVSPDLLRRYRDTRAERRAGAGQADVPDWDGASCWASYCGVRWVSGGRTVHSVALRGWSFWLHGTATPSEMAAVQFSFMRKGPPLSMPLRSHFSAAAIFATFQSSLNSW